METNRERELLKIIDYWKAAASDLATQVAGEMVKPGEDIERVAQDYLDQAFDTAVMRLGGGDEN